jgi:hypothetical protein
MRAVWAVACGAGLCCCEAPRPYRDAARHAFERLAADASADDPADRAWFLLQYARLHGDAQAQQVARAAAASLRGAEPSLRSVATLYAAWREYGEEKDLQAARAGVAELARERPGSPAAAWLQSFAFRAGDPQAPDPGPAPASAPEADRGFGEAMAGNLLLRLDAGAVRAPAPEPFPGQPSPPPFAWRGAWLQPREGAPLAGAPLASALGRLQALGVTHVAIGQDVGMPVLREPKLVLAGNDDELVGLLRAIRAQGLQAFLLPRIESPDFFRPPYAWRGDIRFADQGDWDRFHDELERVALHYARLAQQEQVALLGLGLELKHSILHEARWRRLIAAVRGVYGGKLTYSANWWVEWERVPFWDALDCIGIGAYFEIGDPRARHEFVPREESATGLARRWRPILAELAALSQRAGRPVLFTEVGYPGYEDCAERPWEWAGKQKKAVAIDHRRQAVAWDALLQAAAAEPAIAGLFAWSFYAEGPPAEPWEYALEGRPAEAVLRWHYRR